MATTVALPVERSRAPGHGLAYAGLGVSTFGWASGFVAGKLALDAMTPLPVAAWRYALAAVILLPFAVAQRPRRGLGRAAGPLVLMIACGGVVYPWLFLAALARTTAASTALLIALNPVFTLLLAPLVGERLDARRVAGILVALGGAALVITRGDLGHAAGGGVHHGDLLALAAAATWAVFNTASRAVVLHLTPAFTNCLIYAVGGVALFLLGLPEGPWTQLAAAPPRALGGIAVMAVLSSVVAGQLFLMGVRAVGVARTVVFIYLVPVLTAALATTLLGEPFGLAEAAGGAAVLAGVWWTTRGVPRSA